MKATWELRSGERVEMKQEDGIPRPVVEGGPGTHSGGPCFSQELIEALRNLGLLCAQRCLMCS